LLGKGLDGGRLCQDPPQGVDSGFGGQKRGVRLEGIVTGHTRPDVDIVRQHARITGGERLPTPSTPGITGGHVGHNPALSHVERLPAHGSGQVALIEGVIRRFAAPIIMHHDTSDCDAVGMQESAVLAFMTRRLQPPAAGG
jgi:hypothetical protein